MMNIHYILNEQGEPIPEPDLLKWGKWYETAERHVGDTHFGDIHVSTVFLSLPHVSNEVGNDDPMLYETMVFADNATLKRLSELSETDDRSIVLLFTNALAMNAPSWKAEQWDIQKRYATRAEAVEGHKNMCTFIEVCLAKNLLEVKT